MAVHINIVTYNRPKALLNLLEDVRRDTENLKGTVTVTIYDDFSYEDCSDAEAFAEEHGYRWVRFPDNHGKKQFWKLMTQIFEDQKRRSGYFFFLQDDLRLCDDFFSKAIDTWVRIDDPDIGTLVPLRDKARIGNAGWTGMPTVDGEHADNTGWVDCIFMCKKPALRAIKYRIPQIPLSRWDKHPEYSSGVGAHLSLTLKGSKLNMYRTKESLVLHMPIKSQMHPEHRLDSDMSADNFIDGDDAALNLSRPDMVVAALASIPSRVKALEQVVASLLPQVDKVCVYLNGYEEVPRFLTGNDKIHFVLEQKDTLGDRAKFRFLPTADDPDCFYLSCDDDIVYPADYVEKMINHLEHRDKRAIVGAHGRVLKQNAGNLRYYDSAVVYSYAKHIPNDTPVQILGTGVMAFHTSFFKPDVSEMQHKNMADVYVAVQAKAVSAPMVCIRHDAGWLKTIDDAQKGSIYRTHRRDDAPQTDLLHTNLPWSPQPDPLPVFGGPTDIGSAKVLWKRKFKRQKGRAAGPQMDTFAQKAHVDQVYAAALRHLQGGKALLDYGCAWGRFKPYVEDRFQKYVGVDIIDDWRGYRESRGIKGDFRVMSNSLIPARDGEFDTIACINVLSECGESVVEAAVGEWKRVLGRGGTIVVMEPFGGALRSVLAYQKMLPQLSLREEIKVDGIRYAIMVGSPRRRRRRR